MCSYTLFCTCGQLRLTCKNRAPPLEPPQPLDRLGGALSSVTSFGALRNFAALHSHLKMDGISRSTPFAAVGFPQTAKIV